MAAGAAWLGGVHRTHASQTVTYLHGSHRVSLPATPSRPSAVVDVQLSVLVDATEMGFFITATDLVIDGSAVDPAVGDRIEWVHNGATETYEVLPPAERDQHFQRFPNGRLLIHTKLVTRL
jgi:hypothetical protein